MNDEDLKLIKSIQNKAAKWATDFHYYVDSSCTKIRDNVRYKVWIFNGTIVSIVVNTSLDGCFIQRSDMPLPYIHMLPEDRKL